MGESNNAIEKVVTAGPPPVRGQWQTGKHRLSDKKRKMKCLPQQTDFMWPSASRVTKVLKDKRKKYRQVLDKPEFLRNLSGSRGCLIGQYN